MRMKSTRDSQVGWVWKGVVGVCRRGGSMTGAAIGVLSDSSASNEGIYHTGMPENIEGDSDSRQTRRTPIARRRHPRRLVPAPTG